MLMIILILLLSASSTSGGRHHFPHNLLSSQKALEVRTYGAARVSDPNPVSNFSGFLAQELQ